MKKLHIVAFDIPWPANYGGAIDIFYKLKAIAELGYSIHLHAFLYHRNPSQHLNYYCSKVSYYPRHINKTLLLHKLPYIVVSRRNLDLENNLFNDDHPVLLEGLHTTSILENQHSLKKKIVVRTHNIEHDYYRALADAEKNIFKKLYFQREASKLESWEPVLKQANGLAVISPAELSHFRELNPVTKLTQAFHPFKTISTSGGKGTYALYHGNLAVAENNQAALFLVNKVFSKINYPLIIAGNHASGELRNRIAGSSHITLCHNPDQQTMEDLISNAQMNILPTFQSTGIKLKMLYALYLGRFCIANNAMVQGTGLESGCEICNSPEEFISSILKLREAEFTEDQLANRKNILSGWDVMENAANLVKMLE